MSLSKPLAVDSSRWGSLCCFSHAFPQNLTFPWFLDFSDPEHLFPHIISSRAIPLATSFPTAVWYPLLFHFLFIHEFFRLSKALNFLSSCVTLIARSEFLTSFFFFFSNQTVVLGSLAWNQWVLAQPNVFTVQTYPVTLTVPSLIILPKVPSISPAPDPGPELISFKSPGLSFSVPHLP